MTTEHENPAPEETPAPEAPKKPVKKASRKAAKKSTAPTNGSSARPQTASAPAKGKASQKVAPSKPLTEERAEPDETAEQKVAPQTAPETAPEAQRPVASVNGTRSDAVDPAAFPPSETAIPPLDPTVPPPGGEKPIAYTPFAPLGAKGPHGDEPIEANLQRAILESTKKITDNAPALYELMKNDRTQPPVYVPTAPQHRPSGEASVPSPKPPKAPTAEPALQAAKPVKKTKKARKKPAKAVPNASTAPSPQGPAQVPSGEKADGQTTSDAAPEAGSKAAPKAAPKSAPKATPRIRFRVEDAPVEEEKKPAVSKEAKGPKGPKPALSDLFSLSDTDAEVLTTEESPAGESASAKTFEGSETSAYPETPDMTSPDDLDRPDDTPEAERLLGRRAALPRQTEARDAEGETLLSRPRVANVPMGRIARRALERTTERLAREEGRAVPKTAAEERNARILRAPHDVRPEDPDSLESIRSAMRAEEEVDAVLNEILESSRSVEEANAKMNKLLAELTACDPVQAPDGTTHYKIRDPEAFRRSILFSKLLLLPDLRTGPTWMRSVIRARHEAGCALRLTEAFTLELDRDALPDDSPLRLDDSGAFVERTSETPPPPNPAVTTLLTEGDPVRADRRVKSEPKTPRDASLPTQTQTTARSEDRFLRTAPLGAVPREAFLRTPWDAGVQLLKVSVFLGVAFVGGLLGGRTALSDPGLLHTDRLAFVDLTSVAKSGFPDAEGFPEAFRAVLNKISEERGLVLVAKNFLLTGPAPETRDRDLTVEVITGLIDRLGMPGERGMRVPTWDLPKEVERVLMPSSTEAANERVGKSGAFDDPVARGRGTDALGVPYLKPLPEDASRTLFATEHAARASRLSALEAEKSARQATRAAEDLRREIERRKADRTFRDTAQERLEAP